MKNLQKDSSGSHGQKQQACQAFNATRRIFRLTKPLPLYDYVTAVGMAVPV
jgi:hypothetical protein